MALKKNDKIIIAVGVIIIIIAAVLIAAYAPPEEEEEEIELEEKLFDVTWTQYTGTKSMDGYAGKRAAYSEAIEVSSPSGSVLTKVEMVINWEDDVTYGIIRSKGLDTLTANVGLSGGGTETQESTGAGNMTFTFSINSRPSDDSIEAETEFDAEEGLKGMYEGENRASFDVAVSVDTGERIWRLLKFLRDGGNSFDIEISYEYYKADLLEVEGSENGDDKNTDLDNNELWQTSYASMLSTGRI